MTTQLEEIRDKQELIHSLGTAKDIITRDYLYRLGDFKVCALPVELKELDITEYTRVYKFRKLVSDKNESMLDKLVTVLNAAYSSKATVITIIKGYQTHTDYFLGVVSKDINQEVCDIGTQGESFKGVLNGNFPGLSIETLRESDIRKLCDSVFANDYITSISGIASVRDEDETNMEKYVQGIEHLVDSLQGREYGIVLIADPVSAYEVACARNGYQSLYTQLSPFLKTSLSFNESDSITVTQTHTEGVTKTIGESTTLSQNYSQTNGWNKSTTHGTNTNKNTGALVGAVAGIASLGAIALTGGAAAPMLVAAGGVAGTAGMAGSAIIGAKGKNHAETYGENGGYTIASGKAINYNSATANQKMDAEGQSEGTSHGRTFQFENENKTVRDMLERIDKHIKRLDKCDAFGAFNCASYVISSDPETNAIVSNAYNALMRGEDSSLQASYINSWTPNDRNGKVIKEYLRRFSHPLFMDDVDESVKVSPASIASAYELAVNIGLPKKSINGLPVLEMASFGRNVFEASGKKEYKRMLKLGQIHHMGNDELESVALDIQSLSMHTFITGSTGSGKSNAIYTILEKLMKTSVADDKSQKIKFMVIEPAKGEYKDKFGSYENVNVYGTNPKKMPLLRINPFSFPEDVHVLEHIDRLVEIFNVCWPMYAAMPAILKDSIERAYIAAGWDLLESETEYQDMGGRKLYPNFLDVLKQIDLVIKESKYSAENKSNYVGALSTRVKSLTNGLYGQIFTSNEIAPEVLFDENAVVDLSRVGSIETKALIMGILVMKLQEYRMSSRKKNNAGLKHVTVLEEAHNLLKRTSTEQNSESSNLLGKSVEMLANAIAEMRTYGEGFIIADQSPGLMDMSVIRNTNTKIILRLPDMSDRELVGRAASLNDSQILELARLETGVAAIYQNNWIEPVLCHIDRCSDDEKPYNYKTDKQNEDKNYLNDIIDYVLLPIPKKLTLDADYMKELEEKIYFAPLASDTKMLLKKYIKAEKVEEVRSLRGDIIFDIFNTEDNEMLISNVERKNMKIWYNMMVERLEPSLEEFEEDEKNKILALITGERATRERSEGAVGLYEDLMRFIGSRLS